MEKFLCDQMCAQLGRWLRTAGYDTLIITSAIPDEMIFKQAVQQGRLLLTRDAHFKKMDPEGRTVFYLGSENLDEWAQQLKKRGVNWLFAPFTRCLRCNIELEKTLPPDNEGKIPKDVKEFWRCPSCKGLFWRGSHTQRMEAQLKAWAYLGDPVP